MKTYRAAKKRCMWPIVLYAVIIVFGLIPILALSFYARAGADDFSYAWPFVKPTVEAGGNLFDVLAAAAATSAHYFETWQGLYTSAFVLALEPTSFSESAYWLSTWLLLAFSAIAFSAISWAICCRYLQSTSRAWIGVGLTSWFFFIQTLPNIYEGLFWFNGAYNYLFFWCIFMLIITVALVFLTSVHPKRFWWLILTCVLAFVLAGGNHVTTVSCIAILFLFALWELIQKRSGWLFFAFAVCVIGFCIVAAAPGTKVRSDALGINTTSTHAILKNLVLSLGNSAWYVVEHFGRYTTFSLLAFIVAILPFAAAVGRNAKHVPRVRSEFWAALFASMFFIFWAPLYLLQVSTRGPGAGRVDDVFYASFVMCITCFVLVAATALVKRDNSRLQGFAINYKPIPAYLLSSAGLCIILFSFGSSLPFTKSSWSYAYEDLESEAAATYAQETDARIAILNNPTQTDIIFEPRSANPKTISTPEYSSDPTYWINTNAAKFYQKNSIALKKVD